MNTKACSSRAHLDRLNVIQTFAAAALQDIIATKGDRSVDDFIGVR